MEHIEDGKNTLMRIEEKLDEKKRSEDQFNRDTLSLTKATLYITCLILILTIYQTIVANSKIISYLFP